MKLSPKLRFILACLGIAIIIINGRMMYYFYGQFFHLNYFLIALLLGLALTIPAILYVLNERKKL